MYKKILYADDSSTVHTVVDIMLRGTGIQVHFAKDGREAIQRLQEVPGIEAVLLDIHMPGMNGFEVLEHLEQFGGNLPVIIISAEDDDRSLVQAMRLGAAAYIKKPFSRKTVLEILEKLESRGVTTRSKRSVATVLPAKFAALPG